MNAQPATSQTSATVDFVLITALPEERDALLGQLPGYSKLPPTHADVRTYFRAELPVFFPDHTFGTYRVVVTCSGMGRVNAATATKDAIGRWQPSYVVLVGIAGGIADKDLQIGDILIASQIVDYELQKITPADPEVRWEVYQVDAGLLNACNNFQDKNWPALIQTKRPAPGEPKFYFGPIASGDKVIAYKPVLDKYQGVWAKLLGVEMEAAGVAAAAHQVPAPKRPGFFMVRSVSDFADKEKNSEVVKSWRSYVCDTAASFAVAFLKNGPIPLAAGAVSVRTKQVQLIVEGEFKDFDATRQAHMVGALAGLLEIPPGHIKILRVLPGSVAVLLEMSETAAERLYALALAQNVKLVGLGIKSVLIENREVVLLVDKEFKPMPLTEIWKKNLNPVGEFNLTQVHLLWPGALTDQSTQLQAFALQAPSKPEWVYDLASVGIRGLVVLPQDHILFSTFSLSGLQRIGAVVVLDAWGQRLWQWAAESTSVSAPAVSVNAVWVVVGNKVLVSLDLGTGKELKQWPLPSGFKSTPAAPLVTASQVFVPGHNAVLAWNYREQTHWLFNLPKSVTNAPVLSGTGLIILTSGEEIIALDPATRQLRWRKVLGLAGKNLSAPLCQEDQLWVGAGDGVYALRVTDGKQLWHFSSKRSVHAKPLLADKTNVIYAAGHDDYFYALDAETGKELGRYNMQHRIDADPGLTADGAWVVVADRFGNVAAVQAVQRTPSQQVVATPPENTQQKYLPEQKKSNPSATPPTPPPNTGAAARRAQEYTELQRQWNDLTEQYNAVMEDLDIEIESLRRRSLQKRAERILVERQAIGDKLRAFEANEQ